MVDMLGFGNVVVNKFCPAHTEKIGAYRMLGNDSFDHNDLANGVYRACKKNVHSVHLLCIQDTSEINFSHHLGISSLDIWNRSFDKVNKYGRDYHNQDIKEKESYRWVTSAQKTKELLTKVSCLTIIGDRESDVYDEFVLIPDHRTHLLHQS
jgi:hypothetical protein